MFPLGSACLQVGSSLLDALSVIESSGLQIALIINSQSKLLGTLSDGDIRRALLNGCTISTSVDDIMNTSFTYGTSNQSQEDHFLLMKNNSLRHLPILDDENVLTNLLLCDSLTSRQSIPNSVVLMAGGVGSRLYPLTADTPKPMLLINDKPILSHIIDHYKKFGFHHFYISVNYLKESIIDYFGDGSRFDVTISYLEESTPLGTAGALSLLPSSLDLPFIVTNADILSSFNPASLLRFHTESNACATVCSRLHETQVPFGVLDFSDNKLIGFNEKPSFTHLVNAGIYVLDPICLRSLEFNQKIDMTDLVSNLCRSDFAVSIYNLHEHWIDIGRPDTLNKAIADFPIHYI